MKNQVFSSFLIFLLLLSFSSFVSAKVEISMVMIPDTINICPKPPYVQLVPDGLEYVEENTYLACMYDTIALDAGSGFNYSWDNQSTEQTHSFYTTGIGYDEQTHWVVAEADVAGCFDTAWITIIFSPQVCVTGIEDKYNDSFGKIYPNPGTGKFNLPIKDIQSHMQIEVLDLNGQLKGQTTITGSAGSSTQSIDLSTYANGFYFIRIIGEDFVHVEKVVKE